MKLLNNAFHEEDNHFGYNFLFCLLFALPQDKQSFLIEIGSLQIERDVANPIYGQTNQ